MAINIGSLWEGNRGGGVRCQHERPQTDAAI